jgi:hypothetical protein
MISLERARRDVAVRKDALRTSDGYAASKATGHFVRLALPISVGLAISAVAMRRTRLLRAAAPLAASAGVAVGRRVADELLARAQAD